MGSRWAKRQMGHSSLLSKGGSNLASYPSILNDTTDRERVSGSVINTNSKPVVGLSSSQARVQCRRDTEVGHN